MMANIQLIPIASLKPNPRKARIHSAKQVEQLARSMKTSTYFNPIVVDEDRNIIAGHGRYRAARSLEITQVPVIELRGLSAAKKRALALADNKIATNAGWDREILAVEIPQLAELLIEEGLDIFDTGFAPVEIDQLAVDFEEQSSDDADHLYPEWLAAQPVTKPGELWELGNHRLLCGDARGPDAVSRLMDGQRAAMAFLDVPYNRRVRDIVGRGERKHEEFAMASGELSREEFVEFLSKALGAAAAISRDGALHYVCIDWRHIGELIEAGRTTYQEMINLAVWVKSNAGQGSLYRSQHELVGIFRADGDRPALR